MDIRAINNSLDYIEKHLMEKINISQIASHVSYSDFHFSRMFAEGVGLTIKQYVSSRRVVHVLYEVTLGKALITAAFDYGYDDYSSFYKACKRVFGLSPKKCLDLLTIKEPRVFFIGKEKYPMITEGKLKTVIKNWQLKDYKMSPIYNENGQASKNIFLVGGYRAIVTNNYHKVIESKRLSDALNHDGLKTPCYLVTKSGEYYVKIDDQYVVLVEELDASTYTKDEILSSKEVRLSMGRAIGRLHLVLESFEVGEEESNVYDTCNDWAIDIVKALVYEEVLPKSFYEDFKKFEALSKRLNKSFIHRNPHMHNLFFKDDDIVAYGDLHLATYDLTLFDICYLCTSLLAEPGVDRDVWLTKYKDIVEGYNQIKHLNEDENKAIPYMMYAIQLIFIAYFASQDGHHDLAEKNYVLLKWLYENLD